MCQLGGSDAFYNTKLQSIYVPTSLVEAYKSDTAWRYFSSKIIGI